VAGVWNALAMAGVERVEAARDPRASSPAGELLDKAIEVVSQP